MKVIYPYDTTPFVKVAIDEVVKTLFEAILLVFLVMYLFLGNIRATLIPTLAVPVVILGTFAVLGLFGFSINMLTMFAMVLAIGLLVDDAIVVVENVERVMSEEGLPPKEATRKSMGEITSALIGIGLVLSAVFGPMAFFGGSTGVIYRQFSVTVIAAMLLSVLVALILTPVLCASLLKPVAKGHEAAETGFFLFRPFFRWFDRVFFWTRDRYQAMVGRILAKKLRYLFIYLLIVAALGFLFQRMPTAYLPNEDQGIMFVQAMLPAGSTLEQTEQVLDQVRSHFLVDEKEAVASCFTVAGRGFSGTGQNVGLGIRQAQGLGAAPPGGPESKRPGGTRHGKVLEDPQRHGVRLPAAGSPRAWTGGRVRLSIAGPGRTGSRSLDGGPQPDARHGRPGPEADPCPPQRPGRCVPIPHRRGLGKGGRPGGSHQLHPQHHLGGLRQRLCERLHPGRTGQAGLRPGRRPLPHAAQRPGAALRSQCRGDDDAVHFLRHRPLVPGVAAAGAFQQLPVVEHLG